jgi:hypothetical protein
MRYRDIIKESLILKEDEDSDNGQDDGRYDPAQDEFDRADLGDTRKPKLTLRMVNRLKKIRAAKAIEMAKKDELMGVMYAVKPEADSL